MADSETGVPNAALNAPIAAPVAAPIALVVNSNVPVGNVVGPTAPGVATIGNVVGLNPSVASNNKTVASNGTGVGLNALVGAPNRTGVAPNASTTVSNSVNPKDIVVVVSKDENGNKIFHVDPKNDVPGRFKTYNVNLEPSGGKYTGYAEEREINSSSATETKIDNALNPSIAVNQSGAVPITSVATTTIPVGDPNTSASIPASIPVNNNAKNKSIKEKAINDILRMGGRRKIKTIRSKKRKGTRNRRARQ